MRTILITVMVVISSHLGRLAVQTARTITVKTSAINDTRLATRGVLALVSAAALTAVAACGTADDDGGQAGSGAPAAPEERAEEPVERESAEAAARTARLVLTYDGGIQVLDANSLQTVGEIELDGFNRVSAAGDGRHAIVSADDGFGVLDAGTWAEPHGDHDHYYTTEPALLETRFDAQAPGHVVSTGGRLALFDDGTGSVVSFDVTELTDDGRQAREFTVSEPHHGVAIGLPDGTLVVSESSGEEVTGISVLDADDEQVAASQECPGLHGSQVAAGGTVVIGCNDGALVYSDGEISKVSSPGGGIGTLVGGNDSPIVLGNYNDEDADTVQVSLIDTRSAELTLVEVPAAYSSANIAWGPDGQALVLGTDGDLQVIDPDAGEVVETIAVTEAWQIPEDWQQPRPIVTVLDGSVFVTDPFAAQVFAVDVESAEVWNSAELIVAPNSVAPITGGVPESPEDAEGREDDGHEGADHDHDHDDDHDHGHSEDDGHDHGDDHDHDEDDDHDH